MRHHYSGLPPASSIEQAILLAQLLILKELEQHPLPMEEEKNGNHPIPLGDWPPSDE